MDNQMIKTSTIMTIEQVMTKKVECLRPKDTMDKAIELFNMHDFHHIPVVDSDGVVVGIISKSDVYKIQHTFTFFKRVDSEQYNNAIFHALLAEEVMTQQLVTLHQTDSIKKAVSYFLENRFHALPIVDADQKLLGIITTYDLLRCI